MKLLEKNAESRYQSAAGLKYDLEYCLTHLVATGTIPNFVAGVQDKSSQLLIPQKLYGREQQVETLLAAFSRVATDVATDVVADVADELSVRPILKSSVTSVRHPLPELMLVSGNTDVVADELSVRPILKSSVTSVRHPLPELMLVSGNTDVVADELSVRPILKSSVTSVRHPLPELMLVSGYSGVEKIQAIGITDKTVVELVASNIQKLSNPTQQVLKLAACIGNSFNLDVLAIVSEKSIALTAADLWAALQAGLILPLSNAYKIPLVFDQETSAALPDAGKVAYKFLHDRVQQAAYSLIPFDQKKETHRRIGQLLLVNTPPEERFANIFDIVNQLNVGADSITSPSEKSQLAELNLIAGKKAKKAAAYEPAEKYLKLGLKLLAEDSWSYEYELTLNLYVETVEAEYLITNYQQAKLLCHLAL